MYQYRPSEPYAGYQYTHYPAPNVLYGYIAPPLPPPFYPPLDFGYGACPTVDDFLAWNPLACVRDYLDNFVVPSASRGSAGSCEETLSFLSARKSPVPDGPVAILYHFSLASLLSKIGRSALHRAAHPAIPWTPLDLHTHTRFELNLAAGIVNLNLADVASENDVEVTLIRTGDALRRLTHATMGDYDFISLASIPHIPRRICLPVARFEQKESCGAWSRGRSGGRMM
jgi:hypothetical protein